jgi:DNA repair exonuclease SbcCD ATPase subunit
MSDITAAPKGVVAFGRRNANEERIKQAEEELEQLKNPKKEEENKEDNEEPTSAEEKSFKKRYGDLRRFSQQKEKEYEQRINALEEQLNAASKKEMKLPKTEEEINAVGARRGRSAPNGDGTEGMIYESQIQKMSASEYERNIEAITEAMKNGKFVYDISGAAR